MTFLLSIITLFYWGLVLFSDVYSYAIAGVIYEMLWLPMLAMLVFLPAVSIWMLLKDKQTKRYNWATIGVMLVLCVFIYICR